MQRLILLTFLFVFTANQAISQTELAYEDFEDATLPEGWESIINSGNCAWDSFTSVTPRGMDFSSTALLYNDETCGELERNNNVSILTASYNVSSVNNLLLSVEIGLASETRTSGEQLIIEVYDGTNWQTIRTFTGNWYPYTYLADLSAFTNPELRVRFTYDDNGAYGYYAAIDNFRLTQEAFPELPPQISCSSAVNVDPGIHTVNPIQRGYAPQACVAPGELVTGAAWFSYTASLNGTATVSTVLSQNDQVNTDVNILTGTCGDVQCYARNVNDGPFFSTVTFEVLEGETYYIVFDDKFNNSGFDFSLNEAEETCAPVANLEVDFSDRDAFETCHSVTDYDIDRASWIADAADFKMNGDIEYFATNTTSGSSKNDYLFSPPLQLSGGQTYPIAFSYNGRSDNAFEANETLQVFISTSNEPNDDMILIYQATGIVQQGNDATIYEEATRVTNQQFTPTQDGRYHLVFRVSSDAPNGELLLFNYSIGSTLSTDTPQMKESFNHSYDSRTESLVLKTKNKLKSISIYALSGQRVFYSNLQDQNARINLQGLAKGIYVSRVSATGKEEHSFKFYKK